MKGFTEVGSKSIYVDTDSGEGLDEVLREMRPMINKIAHTYSHDMIDFEDTKQDIAIYILECVKKFDPSRGAKLSTFLFSSVNNKLKNRIRDINKKTNNATTLNVDRCRFSCDCGHTFTASSCGGESVVCPSCGIDIEYKNHGAFVSMKEVAEENIDGTVRKAEEDPDPYYDIICKIDIDRWLKTEDSRTAQIVKMICYDNLTMTDVAKKIGITGSGVSARLKQLQNRAMLKKILNK